MFKKYLILITLFTTQLILIQSCGNKTQVAGVSQTVEQRAPDTVTYKETACAEHSFVRPKVDFLFIWDNSSGFQMMPDSTKEALRSSIALISSRFDYHIVMSPLILNSNQTTMPSLPLMIDNPVDVDPTILNQTDTNFHLIPNDSYIWINTFKLLSNNTASSENNAFKKILDIMNDNSISKGVFRKNAYTIVVLITNDNYKTSTATIATDILNESHQYLLKLKELKDKLGSEQFRLFSLIAFKNSRDHGSNCPVPSTSAGTVYKEASAYFYNDLPSASRDAFSDQNKDSFDLCSGTDFSHLFDGINQSIKDILLKHVYNYWLLTPDKGKNIDPTKIGVKKNSGLQLTPNDPNGFKYVGYLENKNTRKLPTPGEPKSGQFIELQGSGITTYPECLYVTTQDNPDYYGYVVINERPNPSSIKIEINGKQIPENSQNGWTYEGYSASKNIRVKSPTDPSQATIEDLKSGYVIKLNGSAIFSNGSVVDITYRRDAI